jgi:uncharacterized phage-like protein YoqJ
MKYKVYDNIGLFRGQYDQEEAEKLVEKNEDWTLSQTPIKIALTGHRPDKLGLRNPYDRPAFEELVNFAGWAIGRLTEKHGEIEIISGMALGWDLAGVAAARKQRVKCHAYIPFEGQELAWPANSFSVLNYKKLVAVCETRRIITSPRPETPREIGAALNYRNHAMVDDADFILALWDGSAGGTGNCVKYAGKKEKHAYHVWRKWEEMRIK